MASRSESKSNTPVPVFELSRMDFADDNNIASIESGEAGHRPTTSRIPSALNMDESRLDAGRRGQVPHLSSRERDDYLDHAHPRKKVGNKLIPYPIMSTSTGYHALPWMDNPEEERGEFAAFGVGVSLYFRFLKFMTIVYFVLSLLAIPSVVLYALAGKLDTSNQLDLISQTTIGNLGESQILCEDVNDGGDLLLSCEEGGVMGRVEAYYGQPTGQCDCPLNQQPNPSCPGSQVGTQCAPAGSACFFDPVRDVNLPSGEKFRAASCCAKTQSLGLPDFSDLDIKTTDGCNANAAQRIVSGLCTGKSSCQIKIQPSTNYTWAPSPQYKTFCRGQSEVQHTADGSVVECHEAFDAEGGLDSCAGGRFAVRRLVVVAQCFDVNIDINGKVWSKKDVAIIVGVFDLVSSILFLLAWLWLRHKESDAEEANDAATTTASDYTVMVTHLPPHHSMSELQRRLREHFEEVLSDAPAVTKQLDSIKVADINFGMTNSLAIETMKLRGKYLRKLEDLNTSYLMRKRYLAEQRGGASQFTLPSRENLNIDAIMADPDAPDSLVLSYKRVNDKLDRLSQNVKVLESDVHHQRAVAAFITFEEEEGALRALHQFPNDYWSLFMQPRERRINQAYRVWMEKAPEPSDIYWENLQLGRWGRCWRGALTFLVSFLLVFITVVLMFIAESSKRENLRKFPPVQCNTVIDPTNKTLVVLDVNWVQHNQTSGGVGRLECYCKSKLFSGSVEEIIAEDFGEENADGERKWCNAWVQTFLFNRGITYGGVFGVLVINMLMRNVLKTLVQFERPKSKTDALLSVGTKLFIVTVLNTAVIVLIVNARIRSEISWLRIGEYDDFSMSWFSSVGVSLLLTMGFNIIIPHLAPMARALWLRTRRCCDRGCRCDDRITRASTQPKYNKMYQEQHFRLAERYAMVLNTMFVTMAYSTGLPILMPFALVSTIVSFWVDKVFLLRYTMKSAQLGGAMARRATSLMPLALIIHLGLGMWMLGNTKIVAEDALDSALEQASGAAADAQSTVADTIASFNLNLDINERVFAGHVLPMFILFLLFLAALVVYNVVIRRVPELIAFFGCFREKDEGEDLVNYFDAIPPAGLRRALAKGGVKLRLWQRYVTLAEKYLYYDTFKHYSTEASITGREDPNIKTKALAAVQNFRKRILRQNTTALEALFDAQHAARIGSSQNMTQAHAARIGRMTDAAVQNYADFFTAEELRAFEEFSPPPVAKLMPDGDHSYDIHENEEYRYEFALDAYVDKSLTTGLRTTESFKLPSMGGKVQARGPSTTRAAGVAVPSLASTRNLLDSVLGEDQRAQMKPSNRNIR